MPPGDDGLGAGLDRVWTTLTAAVGDRASPFRTPTVATGGRGGADARVLVLRAVDRASASLTFFTDVRAAKVAVIVAAPQVALVAWDPATNLQLRLRGTATVATAGTTVDVAWAQVPGTARRAYRTVAAPGTRSPAPDFAEGGNGRANFAMLTVTLGHIEWLDLAGSSHRRAAFTSCDGAWSGSWLVP